ncbi:complex I assembly factor ACAD9, mitochondrial [Megalopta genalis]|uniref:complex I assembly factor ACAD9, mitochondrial n=1 Tax=Megalopta genalis TaxID=115081 RepID=UPI003FD462B1
MFTRQSFKIKKFFGTKLCGVVTRNVETAAQSETPQFMNFYYFPQQREKQPATDPVLKNLLMGKVNTEVIDMLEPQTIERFKYFKDWLRPIDNYILSCNNSDKKLEKSEILSSLRDLGVFRSYVSEDYHGLNLLNTESLKLMETVGLLPWLGTYLVKNLMLPVKLISKYGSESQKQKYLPKIMSGEITPTICLKENDNGTNINGIQTICRQHDANSVVLNGEKVFVFNGIEANLFLVFVLNQRKHTINPNDISLYLVERDYGGISCNEAYEMIGYHDIPVCSVKFENTLVPKTNIIGEPMSTKAFDIMMDLLKPGKQNIAGQSIAILRNLINRLASDVLEMKQLDRDFYTFHSVQKILGEAVFSLYTMESMAYQTSRLADYYEDQNVELEEVVTETYCANKCLDSVQSALRLLGAQAYMKNNAYIDAYHNALALTTLDLNHVDADIYIGSSVLQYSGIVMSVDITKGRNAAYNPIYVNMKKYMTLFSRKQQIGQYFHPSLQYGAKYLQDSIEVAQSNIENLLLMYGTELTEKHIELHRISVMVTELYATFVNLIRSSRSYKIGLENSTVEKDMAGCIANITMNKIDKIAQEIQDQEVLNGDVYYKSMADLLYTKRRYPMEHPLSRTY